MYINRFLFFSLPFPSLLLFPSHPSFIKSHLSRIHTIQYNTIQHNNIHNEPPHPFFVYPIKDRQIPLTKHMLVFDGGGGRRKRSVSHYVKCTINFLPHPPFSHVLLIPSFPFHFRTRTRSSHVNHSLAHVTFGSVHTLTSVSLCVFL